jgi:hypothetical protein
MHEVKQDAELLSKDNMAQEGGVLRNPYVEARGHMETHERQYGKDMKIA